MADWSWGGPRWNWGGHCRGNVCTSLKLWKLWHKVWNFALIDYWIFGFIVSCQILDITLPAIDGRNNWCSLTIPIWWQNPATLLVQWRFPSMSFKSGLNANFLIGVNLYCMCSTGNIRKAKWYFQGWNDNSNGSCVTLWTLEKFFPSKSLGKQLVNILWHK